VDANGTVTVGVWPVSNEGPEPGKGNALAHFITWQGKPGEQKGHRIRSSQVEKN
jgi:hypothetical protein